MTTDEEKLLAFGKKAIEYLCRNVTENVTHWSSMYTGHKKLTAKELNFVLDNITIEVKITPSCEGHL